MLLAVTFLLPALALCVPVPQNSVVVLQPGDNLEPGASILSPNHSFKLAIENHRMVVYASCDNSPVFSTAGLRSTVEKLELSTAGNLMLYGTAPRRSGNVWQSFSAKGPSGSNASYKLFLTDEGVLQICSVQGNSLQPEQDDCIWHSMKVLHKSCRSSDSREAKAILGEGESLEPGSPSVYSPSREFRLDIQSDGNVVLYRECDGAAVFSTYTSPGTVERLKLLDDGNLVVQGTVGAFWPGLWYSEPWYGSRSYTVHQAEKYANAELRLANDGLLYLCKDGDCFWHSEFYSGSACVNTGV